MEGKESYEVPLLGRPYTHLAPESPGDAEVLWLHCSAISEAKDVNRCPKKMSKRWKKSISRATASGGRRRSMSLTYHTTLDLILFMSCGRFKKVGNTKIWELTIHKQTHSCTKSSIDNKMAKNCIAFIPEIDFWDISHITALQIWWPKGKPVDVTDC